MTIDLFGSDASSNAATYYTTGLKGRYDETKIEDDHVLADEVYPVFEVVGNKIVERKVPALTALNERLRDDYIHEIQAGVDRWNRVMEKCGNRVSAEIAAQGFSSRDWEFCGALHQS